MNAVVEVKDLSVRFATDHGEVAAVDQASFDVREGEILGLVGESGSGKSVTATAILRLIRKELMRQYPKHAWPEDPLTAKPPQPKPPRPR